jgi:tRNA (cmo5U34)-methyltransferase
LLYPSPIDNSTPYLKGVCVKDIERKRTSPLRLIGKPDRLFERGFYPTPFEFNREVAEVFDDMVSRSVPFYKEVIDSVVDWVYRFYQQDTMVYDLGCSTGTTTAAIVQAIAGPMAITGIDQSEPMLQLATKKLAAIDDGEKHVQFLCQNALDVDYHNASFFILNYTLQFLPVGKRHSLLKNIFEALNDGGVLFLSEKVRCHVPVFQETFTQQYEDFKRQAGYSKTEIERKKEALDQVLVPLTIEEHLQLLKKVGFQSVATVLQWNNFVSIVAIKTS